MNGRFLFGVVSMLSVAAFPLTAHADGLVNHEARAPEGRAGVSVVRGQFTDKVEHSKPVSEASAITSGATATYWVEVASSKEPTQVTLVWKLDGLEAGRQTLEIGRAPHWRTWGSWPTKKAKTIEVEVLDKDGASLQKDTLELTQTPKASS